MALRKPLGIRRPAPTLGKPKPKLGLGAKPKRIANPFDDEEEEKAAKPKAGSVFETAAAERKRQEMERNRPWNLSVPVGKSMQVYILDEGEPWKRYEHTVGGGPNSRGKVMQCIKDTSENCPICAKEGKEGAFVLYLTCVVPKDSYTKEDGEVVTRHFQKKLFPIKTKMSAKYQRLFEKHGSLRGIVLKVSRDNKMDPATGSDVEVVRKMTEAEIQKLATGRQVPPGEKRDQIVKAKIADAFEYDKVMPSLKARELAQMIGVAHSKGGSVAGAADFDETSWDADDDWGGDDA